LTSPAGGADSAASAEFAKAVSYGAGVEKKVWRSEWTIPFSALGIKPGEKALVSMSLTAYRSEDDLYAQYAGTLGETWDLTSAMRLMINWTDGTGIGPKLSVPTVATPPTGPTWPGKAIELAQTFTGVPLPAAPGSANVVRCGKDLLVRVCIPAKSIKKGSGWGKDDGAEVCIRGKSSGKPVTWVIHGFAGGAFELSDEAGAPSAACKAMRAKIGFAASVSAGNWCGEWRLPLEAMGVDPKAPVPFNIGVFRTEDRQWINWVGTNGPSWELDRSGCLKLVESAK